MMDMQLLMSEQRDGLPGDQLPRSSLDQEIEHAAKNCSTINSRRGYQQGYYQGEARKRGAC